MKKLTIITLLILCAGCTKKSTPQPQPSPAPEPTLIGRWYIATTTFISYKNGSVEGTDTDIEDHLTAYNFNSDGSGSAVAGSDTSNFSYTLVSKTLTITFSPTNFIVYTIRSLSSNSLDVFNEIDKLATNEKTTFEIFFDK